MPDYKSMYFRLFNMVTDSIALLQQAQADSEDAFISGADTPPLKLLDLPERDETEPPSE